MQPAARYPFASMTARPGGSAAHPDALRAPAPGGMVLDRVSEPPALRQAVEDYLLHESITAASEDRNALLQKQRRRQSYPRPSHAVWGARSSARLSSWRDAAGAKAVALVLYAHGKAVLWRLATDPQAHIPQDWLRARVMRAIGKRRDTEVHDGVGDHGLAGGDAGRISARYAPRLEKPFAQKSIGLSRRLSDAWRGRMIPSVYPAPERGASSPARPSSAPGGAKRAKADPRLAVVAALQQGETLRQAGRWPRCSPQPRRARRDGASRLARRL